LGSLNIPYQHTGLATTRKYLQAHPIEATNFMKAILEAIARMKNDPEGTKYVMAKYLLLDPTKDAAALEDAYNTLILNDLADIPFPTLPGIQTIIDNLKSSNPSASQISPDKVVDVSILTSLQQSGFIAQLGK
jgi:ABC-type nitrate/sulfonate/bicarbonate transport system substrate-binding protein